MFNVIASFASQCFQLLSLTYHGIGTSVGFEFEKNEFHPVHLKVPTIADKTFEALCILEKFPLEIPPPSIAMLEADGNVKYVLFNQPTLQRVKGAFSSNSILW